jgi:DNA-binding Lrp family transcriptional regulator
MDSAFVLINCDTGSEEFLIEQLKKMDNVKEVHGTLGVYDIIVKVESKKPQSLREAIIGDIRKLSHVKSTLTLLSTGGIDTGEKMAELIPDIIPEERRPLVGPADIQDEEDEEEYDDDYDDDYKIN